jgi:hypothetical protein
MLEDSPRSAAQRHGDIHITPVVILPFTSFGPKLAHHLNQFCNLIGVCG